VSKLTPNVDGYYLRLKDALLHEFKLSPNTYLERFNSCCKSGEEAFVAFASRLKGLLNYYLDSRYVTDFAKLCELLVCSRIKSTLSDSCLQYVLSIESVTKDGWMPVEELTSSIDRYQSAHSVAGVPRVRLRLVHLRDLFVRRRMVLVRNRMALVHSGMGHLLKHHLRIRRDPPHPGLAQVRMV